jgi:hypothetical protein
MTVAQTNLVVWYKLDELSGTIIHDSSGNGYNGTSANPVTPVAGKIGGALSFNGTSDYVIIPYTSGLAAATYGKNLTISLWVNDIGDYVDFAFGNNGSEHKLYATGDGVICQIQATPIVSLTASFGNAITGWNNYVFTLKQVNSNIQLDTYINGVHSDTDLTTGSLAAYSIDENMFLADIGNDGDFDPRFVIKCVLDDVRIYNKALSVDEVKQIYNEGNLNQNQLNSTGERFLSEIGV